MAKALLTCDCLGSQKLDSEALSAATGLDIRSPCHELCGADIDRATEALRAGNATICCQQESRLFDALADELGVASADYIDLRDRAGWSRDTSSKTPKMAALLAEAILPRKPTKYRDVVSEGLCLILGKPNVSVLAAEHLKDHLSVTVLMSYDDDVPDTRSFDVIAGDFHQAAGALGRFEVAIQNARQASLGGAGARSWSEIAGFARSECDIILDLTGNRPLFPAHEKREGYLRADPSHLPSVFEAILKASHLVGTFEKPLYVKTEPVLCAHSRAEQTGCSRCLDLCPTGAISPAGDHVVVDPLICAGCGACSAVCPSGAISYDAPEVDHLFRRIQTLAKTYLEAGGATPRLLVVTQQGAEMIQLAARHGDGLPANVIPFEVEALNVFGHAEMLAARAAGFTSITLVPSRGTDRKALDAQIEVASAIAGHTLHLVDTVDPEVLIAHLYDEEPLPPIVAPIRPLGSRRQITRAAAKALNEAEMIALPDGAPYGDVIVDKSACTLCLSCVSLCPSGALGDNPDLPQLRFQEDACLQCGLCAKICPEEAISYDARLNLTDEALSQRILNEEEPFACVECGVLFGSKSTIDRITEKLTGHSMFADPARLRMIQMCDTCRVNAQYHSDDNPFAAGERPRQSTTDDYLSKRRDH